MILFVGLTDYVIRNLLRSSFAERARHLQLRLHGLVYPEIFDAYSKMLETEINMTSEPQDLVRLFDCASANLERIHFRANLYQRSRVNCRTFRAKRRNSSAEQATPLALRLKFEAALLFGKMGGMLGWERNLEEEYFRELAQSDYVKNHCVPYLTRMRPSVVVSASADGFPDTPWLVAAALLGIPKAIWIRSWDNITTKCELIPDAESFLVWSEFMERELELYFPKCRDRSIIRIGTPQFDGHHDPSNIIPRKEFCSRAGLDPDRPIILYCTGGTHICQNEHQVIQQVHRLVEGLKDVGSPQLLVRLHPYFWDTNIDFYNSIPENVKFWPKREEATKRFNRSSSGLLDDYQVMLSSFYHQAVNVNIASTVTVDSAVYDRPIVCIAFDGPQKLPRWLSVRRFYLEYEHFIQVVKTGAAEVAWNEEELRGALIRALTEPRRLSAQRKRLVDMECGEIDGKAGERLADALNLMAQIKGQESFTTHPDGQLYNVGIAT